MKRIVCSILMSTAVAALCACAGFARFDATANTETEPALGRRGMVSSAHPIATRAGLGVLASGGSAFDAAVAVAATLNVVEPQNSGIGGYGLILIYDANRGRVRVLNCSGRFPKAVDSDYFRAGAPDYQANRRGAKAVSTPTNVNAWEELWTEYGRLKWEVLFDLAIKMADEGFAINESLARALRGSFDRFSGHARVIYGIKDRPLKEGEILRQEALALSLQLISRQGARAVYGGRLGQAIDVTMRRSDGFLRFSDLLANEAEWWQPVSINYRGYEVVTASPPANSFSSLMRLGMMERFDPQALGHNTAPYLHRFAEVTKHAYWCRLAYAGDPDVAPPPLGRLLSPEYWDEQVAAIDLQKASTFEPPGMTAFAGGDTTHFVVADRWGNVVSATQTLGSGFGSKILVPGTGIWLNNSMYFCTFEPKGNPMDAHPGRRKLISNHPTFVMREGRPWIAIGTPGGHTIGQTVPQMIMNLVDFHMDVQSAIAAPRVSFAEPNRLSVEQAIPEPVRLELEAMGHEVRTTRAIGNGHGLTIEYHKGRAVRFTGGADPRGRGQAKGY